MTGITHTEDVTPSNTVDLQHECSAIYVGTGGDVAGVETNGGVSLYKNVPSGAYIYGIFRRVNATGTNAADMIASRGLVPFVHSAAKTSITEWNAVTTHYIDDVRLHNGGIWSSNTTNLDSEPISGNADWTLVGGTPYVIASLIADQIRNANASPLLSVVPSPGLGKALQFLNAFAMPTPGTIPFGSVDAKIFYDGDTTQLVENTSFMSLGFGIDPPPSTVFATSIGSGVENFTRGTIEDAGLMLQTDTQNATEGALLTGVPNAGGSGYTNGNTFTVDGFAGSCHVTGVSGGAVTSFAVDDGGYAFRPDMTELTTTATSGGGSGLTIDVSTVTPANGTAMVKITYSIVDLP